LIIEHPLLGFTQWKCKMLLDCSR